MGMPPAAPVGRARSRRPDRDPCPGWEVRPQGSCPPGLRPRARRAGYGCRSSRVDSNWYRRRSARAKCLKLGAWPVLPAGCKSAHDHTETSTVSGAKTEVGSSPSFPTSASWQLRDCQRQRLSWARRRLGEGLLVRRSAAEVTKVKSGSARFCPEQKGARSNKRPRRQHRRGSWVYERSVVVTHASAGVGPDGDRSAVAIA